MDANLQQMFQLAEERDWATATGTRVAWDTESRLLRLVGVRVPSWTEAAFVGTGRRKVAPGAVDRFGTHARIEQSDALMPQWRVVASGAVTGDVELVPPGPQEISDAVISDDVLYLAIDGRVALRDLRDRWDPMTVDVDGGRAWRLAPRPDGVHVAVIDGGGSEGIAAGRCKLGPPSGVGTVYF